MRYLNWYVGRYSHISMVQSISELLIIHFLYHEHSVGWQVICGGSRSARLRITYVLVAFKSVAKHSHGNVGHIFVQEIIARITVKKASLDNKDDWIYLRSLPASTKLIRKPSDQCSTSSHSLNQLLHKFPASSLLRDLWNGTQSPQASSPLAIIVLFLRSRSKIAKIPGFMQ